MDRRVTPPKRVTSPTWGPPPPCKQALRYPQQTKQSTVQKKCKRNSVFFVLCSRENSTKFRHEISSKRLRIFVQSNEISLSSWRNFASTEAKFRLAEISRSENSQLRNFAIAKIRAREISPGRKFAAAKFPQSIILLAVEEGCNKNLLFAPL